MNSDFSRYAGWSVIKYDSPSFGTGSAFFAFSSGGINRSSKIFVIFVPEGPSAAGPGIYAGAGLAAAGFSGCFGGVSGFLAAASALSVSGVVFCFSSGFFGSAAGAGFTSVGFSSGFGDVSGFLLFASALSGDETAFGFSSGFFGSVASADFTSVGFSGDFGGASGFFASASAFSAFSGASRFLPISLSGSSFPGGVPSPLLRKRNSFASLSLMS